MTRKKTEDLTAVDLITIAGQEINHLKLTVAKLTVELEQYREQPFETAEIARHRERANEAQSQWENHQAQDCALKCAAEIEEVLGTRDPVEAAKILRDLKRQFEDCEAVLASFDPGWKTENKEER